MLRVRGRGGRARRVRAARERVPIARHLSDSWPRADRGACNTRTAIVSATSRVARTRQDEQITRATSGATCARYDTHQSFMLRRVGREATRLAVYGAAHGHAPPNAGNGYVDRFADQRKLIMPAVQSDGGAARVRQ
ncbi:hypothetical protein EVAR_16263_1 [Eumeta japonica]|uniref:Uncharacterized protein n=1 Tax=Eumeta variegata TaxID=151549 RepID=A0A4C1U5Q5_EUMVA|nr:hypothetical protein EVAR_16263_1 [Eumeta japonica]